MPHIQIRTLPGNWIELSWGLKITGYPDKEYEGTGIGLAIVRKATERIGGFIALFSELGKGSRFLITLKKPQ